MRRRPCGIGGVNSRHRTWCGHPRRVPAHLDAQVGGPSSPARKLTIGLGRVIRRIGPLSVDQNWSAPMTSPPARVERELKTSASIVSLGNRTDPSQNAKLHPPGCRLQKLSAAADLLLGTTTHV